MDLKIHHLTRTALAKITDDYMLLRTTVFYLVIKLKTLFRLLAVEYWQGLKELMAMKLLKQCLTHSKSSKMLAVMI